MSTARAVYVSAGFLAALQIACAGYIANHTPKVPETEPFFVRANAVPQVLWDGNELHIDLATLGPIDPSRTVDTTQPALHVTLSRPAAETLFRNLLQIHGARPPQDRGTKPGINSGESVPTL